MIYSGIYCVYSFNFFLYSASGHQIMAKNSVMSPTVSAFYNAGVHTNDRLSEMISDFHEAIESGNDGGRIKILAEDVILLPNHWTMGTWKKSVSESVRWGAAAVIKIKDRSIIRKKDRGDIACIVNSYYSTCYRLGDSARWHRIKMCTSGNAIQKKGGNLLWISGTVMSRWISL